MQTLHLNNKKWGAPYIMEDGSPVEQFHITGCDTSGRRFKKIYPATQAGYKAALMFIKLWKGTVWAKLFNGKRRKLKTVVN